MACQVCHSAGDYVQCYSCHVGKDEDGLPYYRQLAPSELGFKAELFLTVHDVLPEELGANHSVIVPEVPTLP